MLHLQNTSRQALGIACMALALAVPTLAAARAPASPSASPSASVYLEDLTSPELRARIEAGTGTVLVPIGGTEQSGPHIALGKHNVRARVLAGRIAQRLGNAVVAPVVAYVPEGSITPPSGHMRFAGTISIPDAAFEALLEASARSFCQHGLREVVFLGDHGGYQKSEEKVAARLNHGWSGSGAGCHAHALLDYYDVTQGAYVAELKRRGYSDAEIGLHAGLADTSLMLAVDPSLVRQDQLAAGSRAGVAGGVRGDPARATAELGQIGVQQQVDASVAAIRAVEQTKPVLNPSKHK
jgi:creatinine amidohydrolase/Fe(II)-dependent formamide hydrolase-like protein